MEEALWRYVEPLPEQNSHMLWVNANLKKEIQRKAKLWELDEIKKAVKE
jgi:hypothetical protein